jgi:hypothetical protein
MASAKTGERAISLVAYRTAITLPKILLERGDRLYVKCFRCDCLGKCGEGWGDRLA